MCTRTWRGILTVVLLGGVLACRSSTRGESSNGVTSSTSSVSAAAEGSSDPVLRTEPDGASSVGPGADLPSLLPRFASGEAPVYPRMSRRLGEEGWVEIAIDLRQDGEVVGLAISASSGSARLEKAALDAARTWRFLARTGERGVDRLLHRVTFRLARD